MAKEYLSLKGISYIERNVSGNETFQKELVELGYEYTPVIVIGEKAIDGFDANSIDNALAAIDS